MGYVERAEEAIELAAELEPGNANVRGWQSVLLARRGAHEEAVRAALQQARLGSPIGRIQAAIYGRLNTAFFSPTWTRMPALIEQFREAGSIEEAGALDVWLTVILPLNGEFTVEPLVTASLAPVPRRLHLLAIAGGRLGALIHEALGE